MRVLSTFCIRNIHWPREKGGGEKDALSHFKREGSAGYPLRRCHSLCLVENGGGCAKGEKTKPDLYVRGE